MKIPISLSANGVSKKPLLGNLLLSPSSTAPAKAIVDLVASAAYQLAYLSGLGTQWSSKATNTIRLGKWEGNIRDSGEEVERFKELEKIRKLVNQSTVAIAERKCYREA